MSERTFQVRVNFHTIFILVMTVIIGGCSIIASEDETVGSISVTAFDESGAELFGGKIFLDGVERSETIPAILAGVATGIHAIRVKQAGYSEQFLNVTVIQNQMEMVSFTLPQAPPGLMSVESNPPGALILVDQESTGSVSPFFFTLMESGLREVSVFLDGYKTLSPSLISVIVDPPDTASVMFNLQAGTPGKDEGKIAYDFTLMDDFDNVISLHNYRGHIVMLTFFFSTCQPCLEEFPEIEEAYQAYSQYGVVILGIDPMYSDNIDDVHSVRTGLNLSFKLLLDYGAAFTQQYVLMVFPTNIIIEPGGEINTRFENQVISYEILSEIFDGILGM